MRISKVMSTLLVTIFMVSCVSMTQPSDGNGTAFSPTQPGSAMPTAFPSLAYQDLDLQIARVLWGEISVSATNLQRIDNRITVDVCHDAPMGMNWQARVMVEFVAGEGISLNEYFLENIAPAGDDPNQVCERFFFDAPRGSNFDQATVAVDAIVVFQNEMEMCKPYENEVRQAFSEKGIAIEFECQEDHALIIEPLSWPMELTEEEARDVVLQALIMRGPWQFTLNLGE